MKIDLEEYGKEKPEDRRIADQLDPATGGGCCRVRQMEEQKACLVDVKTEFQAAQWLEEKDWALAG